jgi:hypothetical protein
MISFINDTSVVYTVFMCAKVNAINFPFSTFCCKKIFIAEYCDRFGLYGNTVEVEVTKIILTKVYKTLLADYSQTWISLDLRFLNS